MLFYRNLLYLSLVIYLTTGYYTELLIIRTVGKKLNDITVKVLAVVLIFVIAYLAGLLPIKLKENSSLGTYLDEAEQFAKGVFLGAGLIHLLPDAENNFASLALPSHYPYPVTLCALTLFFLQFLEQRIFAKQHFFQQSETLILPSILLAMLSIHAIIAGAALGVSTSIAGFFMIFLAIIAHKGAESFALSINLLKVGVTDKRTYQLILVFSLMTPFGVLFGSLLNHFLSSEAGVLVNGVFDAIAAGTFLYIATSTHGRNKGLSEYYSFTQMLFFGLGIVTMAVLAIWV